MSPHLSNIATYLPEKKICLCIFNRATYSRCKALIDEISKFPNIKLRVVMSSALLMEKYGKAAHYIAKSHPRAVFDELPLGDIESGHANVVQFSSKIFGGLGVYFSEHNFDAVIVVADRFETLPAAAAASYQNIPLVHIQGGEITGNIDDKVRHAVTMLADYHYVATDAAKQNVLRFTGERSRIHNYGCPSLDLIKRNRIRKHAPKEKYILSIFHPETENTSQAFEQTRIVLESALEYCSEYGYRCYWFYPNPDPGREEVVRLLDKCLSEHPAFFIKAINKEPEDFLRQLAGARMIIGNSSCGIRESSFIGVPSVNIGERQRLRERGINLVDVPNYDKTEIVSAMKHQHTQDYSRKDAGAYRFLYGDGNASKTIAQSIVTTDFSLRKSVIALPFNGKEPYFGKGYFELHKKRRPGESKLKGYRAEPRAVQG